MSSFMAPFVVSKDGDLNIYFCQDTVEQTTSTE